MYHALVENSHVVMLSRFHNSYIRSPHARITETNIDVSKEGIWCGTMQLFSGRLINGHSIKFTCSIIYKGVHASG
jgi:hypothetical protein